jgi:hypothetical protein
MSKHIIAPSLPYIGGCYPPSSAQAGQVWYDSGTQLMVIYDGNCWQPYSNGTPEMCAIADDAIDWAIENMLKKSPEIADMIAKYPLVADAVNQLEVVLKLCQNLDDD